MPHAVPSTRQIGVGDAITIDMGCSYNGYCSDMTRTIFVDMIDDKMKEIYDIVLENQQTAINEIADNASIKSIARIVEGNIRINGYDIMHALRSWNRTKCT